MEHSILMVAGEASADAHGAEVVAALAASRPDIRVFGVGGERLRAAGMEVVVDASAISLVGLTEVLTALPRLWHLLGRLTRLARARRPKAALLIDLPDFNLALARRLKALGVPVVYYVSPQLWAWRPRRVRAIRRLVDQMLVILPFEEAFYRDRGVPAEFVGHPLVAETRALPTAHEARAELGLSARRPVVALLPGSRLSEVRRHLPIMLAVLGRLQRRMGAVEVVLPVATLALGDEVARLVAAAQLPVRTLSGQAELALAACDVAVVCSGTATLQTALIGRPMIVVYQVSWLTFQILRRLVRVTHIGLVNLVAGHRVAPELLQEALSGASLAEALEALLRDPVRQLLMRRRFAELRRTLGDGRCAERVAAHLVRRAEPAPLPADHTHAV